jgi:CheY-like chemotaxis protein
MVLMAIWMPGMDGMAAAPEIKTRRPATVVVLTSTTHPSELPLSAGGIEADAVVWKSDLEPRLLDDIWAVRGREPPLARDLRVTRTSVGVTTPTRPRARSLAGAVRS